MKRTQRVIAVVLLLVLVYAVYYIYLGPRLIGDVFAQSMVNFDSEGMANRLCDDTSVMEVINAAGSSTDQRTLLFLRVLTGIAPEDVAQLVTDNLHANTHYDPLSGQYRFSITLTTEIFFLGLHFEPGYTTPEFAVSIRRGWLLPCVVSV